MQNEKTNVGWLLTVGPDECQNIIETTVKKVLDEKEAAKKVERLFTTEEAAEMLRISTVTLWRWKASGRITPMRAEGSRKDLYSESEIQRALRNL